MLIRHLLAGAVLALLFFVPYDVGPDRFIWDPILDAGHFGAFAALTIYLFWELHAAQRPRTFTLALCFALSTFCASMIELIQPFFGRSACVDDILTGALGALCAAIAIETYLRWQGILSDALSLIVLIGPQFVLLIPGYQAWQAAVLRKENFPVIAAFDNELETLLWRPISSSDMPAAAHYFLTLTPSDAPAKALRVETVGGTWSGLQYFAGRQDWREFGELAIQIFSPEEEAFTLSVRIEDDQDCSKYTDRFNGHYAISPGTTTLLIPTEEIAEGPKTRLLHLEAISSIRIYTDRKDKDRVFYLKTIELKP